MAEADEAVKAAGAPLLWSGVAEHQARLRSLLLDLEVARQDLVEAQRERALWGATATDTVSKSVRGLEAAEAEARGRMEQGLRDVAAEAARTLSLWQFVRRFDEPAASSGAHPT